MKRLVGLLFLFALLLGLLPSGASANSGSNQVLKDGHTFSVSYGTSDQGADALLNYAYTRITMPGLRVGGVVCAEGYIYSQGQLRYHSPKQCVNYYPSIGGTTQGLYVYQPANPNQRLRVRPGQSEVRVEFSYVYGGVLNQMDCTRDWCGTATVTTSIR